MLIFTTIGRAMGSLNPKGLRSVYEKLLENHSRFPSIGA